MAHLTTEFAQSNWLGRKMLRACESCARSVSIAWLVIGVLTIAVAVTWLGILVYASWFDGWPSRVISPVLFATAPIVTFIAYDDYRSTESVESLTKRLTWLGVSLVILGVLELGLVVAEFFLLIAIGPSSIF